MEPMKTPWSLSYCRVKNFFIAWACHALLNIYFVLHSYLNFEK